MDSEAGQLRSSKPSGRNESRGPRKAPQRKSGKREGSTNKKQQRLTAAKASALGNCLQGNAGGRPEPQLSESASKALVHWMVPSSLHTVTREIHQGCPAPDL